MQGNVELIRLLDEIDPKQPFGTALFDALTRITVSVAVEAVCLRMEPLHASDPDILEKWYGFEQKVEVYLTQRPMTETAYRGEQHCPGSFLRHGENFIDVFTRLSTREFGTKITPVQFVANVNHPTEERGHVISVVYLCTLEHGDTTKGAWFPVNQLPEKTVECHRHRIIPAAVGAFVAENSRICR